jgi:hypothetical protein
LPLVDVCLEGWHDGVSHHRRQDAVLNIVEGDGACFRNNGGVIFGKDTQASQIIFFRGIWPLPIAIIVLWMMGVAISIIFLYKAKGIPSGPGAVCLGRLINMCTSARVGRAGIACIGMRLL